MSALASKSPSPSLPVPQRAPARRAPLRALARVFQFGEFMIERRLLTRSELLHALMVQDQSPGVPIGQVVAALGYADSPEVEQALDEYHHLDTVEV